MRIFATLICISVLWLMFVPEGAAIPYFSRKYRTSCVTCHEAFPKRNAVGEAFRMRGFRFVDDESYRKTEPVELGDPAYSRLWPHAVWPDTIPPQLPISFVGRSLAEVDLEDKRDESVTVLFPEELELVAADTMGEDISFYGDLIFISKDFSGGSEIDSWITGKAWLQFQSLIGPENVFNLKVGTVGIQSLALYNARDANTFTTHFYQYSTWTMPTVNLSRSGLAYFNGNTFSLQPLTGVELNGVGKRWLYAGGLVSGDVINPVNERPETSFYMVGVSKKAPSDLFLQLAYKLGGLPLDGSAAQVENPLRANPEFWRDDHLLFSLFGYHGEADVDIQDVAGGPIMKYEDTYWRLGLGAEVKYKDLTVSTLYMLGNDDNPYGGLSPESVDSAAWMIEAYYFVYPWLIPYARYEGLDLDLPTGVAGLNPNQDRSRIIVGSKLAIRPNIMLNVEASFYSDDEEVERGVYDTLFFLLSAAF